MRGHADIYYLLETPRLATEIDLNQIKPALITGKKVKNSNKIQTQKSLFKKPVSIVEIKTNHVKSPIRTSPREANNHTKIRPSPKINKSPDVNCKQILSPSSKQKFKQKAVSPPPSVTKTLRLREIEEQPKEAQNKKSKSIGTRLKKIISQTLIKTHQDKQEMIKNEIEARILDNERKEKLKEKNNLIREKNSKVTKRLSNPHKAA